MLFPQPCNYGFAQLGRKRPQFRGFVGLCAFSHPALAQSFKLMGIPGINHRNPGISEIGDVAGHKNQAMHTGGGGDQCVVGRQGAPSGQLGCCLGHGPIHVEQVITKTRQQALAIPGPTHRPVGLTVDR